MKSNFAREDPSERPFKLNDVEGDGTCIIEISSTEPGGSDTWTPTSFKRPVYHILVKCLFFGEHEGGSARRLGISSWRGNKRSIKNGANT